jgi:predicted component of type VI protein secretion system
LVSVGEGEVLIIGPFDVLVGFVKSQSKTNGIDDFLNKREIDIALEEKLLMKKKGNSPLDIILKQKVEDKDILEFANIKPKENIFLDDAFEDVAVDNAYTTHISPPTFVDASATLNTSTSATLSTSENLLQNIFSSKLGINLQSMNEAQQIEVVSQLAETILVALEGVENLERNRTSIERKLEKPNLKVDVPKAKDAKTLIKAQIYGANPVPLAMKLANSFKNIALSHTALYEASKASSEELEHEFAPNTLSQEFKSTSLLTTMMGQDKENWRAYVTKYHYLNEITASKGFQNRLFKKYQSVMETFKLSSGSK